MEQTTDNPPENTREAEIDLNTKTNTNTSTTTGRHSSTASSQPVNASHGMVTSPHQLASEAGLEVLRNGGNAIEAAMVMGTCLSVLYPHFTGLGGDSFMLIADKYGEVTSLSGIGQAAAEYPDYQDSIPNRGPLSMLTSAATVDTLGQAHAISQCRYAGTMSWSDLLQPAIAMACDGFPLSPSQHFWYDYRIDDLATMPGVVSGFSNNGQPYAVGDTLRQPQLGETLKLLAKNGYRDFYEGELAERIAQGLKTAGSPLTKSDLAATRCRHEAPLRVAYGDGELVAHQPPTQGVTTLEIMGILDRFDFSQIEEGSAEYYHVLVEAIKLAFIDRNRYVADPDFNKVPTLELLSPAYLQQQAAKIDTSTAAPWPEPFQTGDTVFMAATDAQGLSVTLLQTVYFDWGSGVQVGDTGMLWHNRGASFSLDPSHPNCLKPGKRPFHTLNPGMYLENGKPTLLYGTQGADGQPQTLATILTRLIDYKLSPEEALTRPRFLLGKTFSDGRDTLKLEADAGKQVFAELAGLGHQLSELSAQSPLAGHPGVIRIDAENGLSGAHDPRSDGLALSLNQDTV